MNFSADLNERRDKMRRALSRVMGEPIEIWFASELDAEIDPTVAGLVSRTLSSLVRERKPESFVEHRPGMLIQDSHLRELNPVTAGLLFDSIAMHEAAHILTTCHVAVDVPADPLANLISTPPATWPDYATGPKWITHDHKFIRALCHVAHRLESRKCRVIISQSFDHELFGLSPIEAYREALGSELEDFDLTPLPEVLSGPMPDAFSKLWARDVVRSLRVDPPMRGKNDD